MSNLSIFGDLVKQANAEKQAKAVAESVRKQTEVAPLLSELFASVSRGKELTAEVLVKQAPLLAEFQSALINPEKFKTEAIDKKERILSLVAELEVKAAQIQEKSDMADISDLDSKISSAIQVADKRFLKLFNRLQNDFQTLKKHVETKSSSTVISSSGSGEVRILRMDDMVKGIAPTEGDTLVWSSALNKFELKQSSGSSGAGPISDEDVPYSKRIDFISDNELYKAEAVVGASELAAVWRIRKVTIGNDFDMIEIWASGNSAYDKRWVDRLTYTYL